MSLPKHVGPGAALRQVRAALARVHTAVYDDARSMPASFYTDQTLLDIERRTLFGQEWVCIGRADEIPSPGDHMTFQLCDEPLVAVRGDDRVIRVLSNVCRHRGALVASGRGTSSHLQCPYHHWTYGLDGMLQRAPRLDEHQSFDPSTCALPSFATEEWMGFVFVSLAHDPAPLAPRLEGLEALVAPYHLELATTRFVADEVWPTNWKCFVENFMEGYHLSPLHRTTLHPVNPTRLCRHYPPGEVYFGYHAGFTPGLPRLEPGHPDLTPEQVDDCIMFAVPPGLVAGCASDYSSFICVQPESVDRVRLKLGLMFFGDRWTDDDIETAAKLFQETNAEDREVLIGITRGHASAHHAPGPLAPAAYEGTLHDFYRYLERRLAPALDEAAGER